MDGQVGGEAEGVRRDCRCCPKPTSRKRRLKSPGLRTGKGAAGNGMARSRPTEARQRTKTKKETTDFFAFPFACFVPSHPRGMSGEAAVTEAFLAGALGGGWYLDLPAQLRAGFRERRGSRVGLPQQKGGGWHRVGVALRLPRREAITTHDAAPTSVGPGGGPAGKLPVSRRERAGAVHAARARC